VAAVVAVAGEAVAVVGKAEVGFGRAVEANGRDLAFVVAVVLAVQQETLGSLLSNGRSLHIGSIQRTGWEGEESCHGFHSKLL